MRAFKYSCSTAFGVALLAIGGAALAGTAAHSATVGGTDPYVRHREVSYSDLNLSRVEDAVKLYGRIERTARDVCRTTSGPSAKAAQVERACASKAIENAVQSVSNTNLTAVHQAHTSKRAMVASSR